MALREMESSESQDVASKTSSFKILFRSLDLCINLSPPRLRSSSRDLQNFSFFSIHPMGLNRSSDSAQDKGKGTEKRPRPDSPSAEGDRTRPRLAVLVTLAEIVAATTGGQSLRDQPPLLQSKIVDARHGPVAVCRELEKMIIGAEDRYLHLSERCDNFKKERDSLRAKNEKLETTLAENVAELLRLKEKLAFRDKALEDLEKVFRNIRSVPGADREAGPSGLKAPKKED